MKTLLIIVIAIVLTIWFGIDFVWCRSLAEREVTLKKDREAYNRNFYILDKRQAELQNQAEVNAREREQNKETELSLAHRMQSADAYQAALDKRAEALHDQKQELDGLLDYYKGVEKAWKELKAEKEAKKVKKAKKEKE